MKALAYSLALVVAAAFGANLASSRAQLYEIHRGGVTRHVGFVNVDKLISLHPESKSLAIMKATLADVRATKISDFSAVAPYRDYPRNSPHISDAKNQPDNSRKALEAEVAWLAVKREADLESDQQQSIQARLRVSREVMMRGAESQISVQIQDIEEGAAVKLRESAEKYGPSRLNAQMKLDALASASKSAGVDPASVKAKQKDAQAALDAINRSSEQEIDAIKADEQSRIDALRKSASAKVDQALAVYATDQNDRIRRDAKTARDETIAELYPSQSASKVAGAAGQQVKITSAPLAVVSALGAEALQRRIAILDARIRVDLSRAIEKLAREKGVVITFARSSSAVPDDTPIYYELLRQHPLSVHDRS